MVDHIDIDDYAKDPALRLVDDRLGAGLVKRVPRDDFETELFEQHIKRLVSERWARTHLYHIVLGDYQGDGVWALTVVREHLAAQESSIEIGLVALGKMTEDDVRRGVRDAAEANFRDGTIALYEMDGGARADESYRIRAIWHIDGASNEAGYPYAPPWALDSEYAYLEIQGGRDVRRVRSILGLSQRAFAEAINHDDPTLRVDAKSVSRWENDHVTPSAHVARVIARLERSQHG